SVCWLQVEAQELVLRGTVLDKNLRDSLQGVTVAVIRDGAGKRLTGRGTATNEHGQFALSVPLGATIQVSLVGYEPHTFKATNENQNSTILLTEGKNELEDAV